MMGLATQIVFLISKIQNKQATRNGKTQLLVIKSLYQVFLKMELLLQARRNWGAPPPQIFAKVGSLPMENDSEKKQNRKLNTN